MHARVRGPLGLIGAKCRLFYTLVSLSSYYGECMALNIKDGETDRLARELAAATGESITVAARRALQERLDRVRARAAAAGEDGKLEAIIARGRARSVLDDRSPDEILGYDDQGLPRR